MRKENIKEDKVEKKRDEDWMTKKWRPMMAMMYMSCCLADFFLFPIMFTIVQFWETAVQNDAFRQWVPITLQGGGLFHVAMGAVLGVTAYGRTQEKVAGVANVSTSLPDSGVATPSLSSSVPAFSGSSLPTPAPAASTGFATEPTPSVSSAPTAPGGRRPVTPGFNV